VRNLSSLQDSKIKAKSNLLPICHPYGIGAVELIIVAGIGLVFVLEVVTDN
jgi:hypothetical protein